MKKKPDYKNLKLWKQTWWGCVIHSGGTFEVSKESVEPSGLGTKSSTCSLDTVHLKSSVNFLPSFASNRATVAKYGST